MLISRLSSRVSTEECAPDKQVLANLKAFIPLCLAEKEKPLQWLGITKSCHVVGTLLLDSSGSL